MSREIMNNATINYSFSGQTETISETSNDNVITLKDQAGLTIVKTAQNSTFVPGGNVTYIVTITNNGTSYFSGVRITDNLGGNGQLTYVDGSALLYYYEQYLKPEIASTNPLVFTLSPLNVGQTMILTYTCKVKSNLPSDITTITNSLTGIGYTYNSEVTTTASCDITRSATSNILISKTSSKTAVSLNEIYNYYITMTNKGTTVANVSSIVDTLPTGFVISSVRLKIGSNTETTLATTDYTLDSNNKFTLPSNTGPNITVPGLSSSGDGVTVVTIVGSINS